jgi:hypothetical protein
LQFTQSAACGQRSTERGDAMPEQAGGEQRPPELDQRIKDYFSARHLDYNDLPPQTYETLLNWPDKEIDVLVKVLTKIGISLGNDPPPDPPLEEGEGLESGKPTTPLKKYQFVVH